MSSASQVGKPPLPWSTAAKIAMRELRAGKTKFLFVLLSVAVGVAALTGVRGFSESFSRALLLQARSIMAGDLSARMYRLATAAELQQLDALRGQGVRTTVATETVSMAMVQGDPVPLLVTLKAVDPSQYPFYGSVGLDPAGDLRAVLNDSSVVVDDNLLVRLRAKVGDQLKIGARWYRIAAVVVREPDRMTAGVGLGPRVMLTRDAMEKSGLLQPGSRATERYLFAIGDKQKVADVRTQIEKILPDAQVTDFRETSPALAEGVDRATGLLSLICLVAMVLGAIGVGMAMRAHLQQRIEILAIMKSIGARSSDILRIYLFQTLMLGIGGALIGIALGLGVEYALPVVFGNLLPLRPDLRLPLNPVLAALGTGILTTLLFCLPPLLDVRKVRPSLVLRRTVEGGDEAGERVFQFRGRGGKWLVATGVAVVLSFAFRHWRRTDLSLVGIALLTIACAFIDPRALLAWAGRQKLQLAAMVVILAGLGGIAAALADSWLVGKWFAVCLAALLVFILALSAVTLRTLRAFLSRTRLHLHSALRHGLANLYRPGNQSAAVLAALGAGVMLILSVFLMQGSIVNALHEDVKPDTPNLFFIDMSTEELPGIEALFKGQPGVIGGLEKIPIVAARLDSIDGVAADELKLKNYPKRMLRSATLSWTPAQPQGTKLTQGKWWTGDGKDSLAVVDYAADRLHLKVGSQVRFAVGEKEIPVRVAAVYKVTGENAFARSEFIVPEALLKDEPTVWYGDIHAKPTAIPDIERVLFAAYPTVTVINIADILQTVQGVVDQITLVIRFLAGFSILSGLIILASSIASTRFRRIREVVVLKTLGATRNRIATVFSVEFVVLGLLAGAVGAAFANVLTRLLLHRMDVGFHADPRGTLVAIGGTAALAVATGWIASFHILGQKPLEVLREE
ncbi:MAG TPA: FtsX-like permease family protein [Acidobacteriaceae bacterium]|jgi:putative ABC transport system permease protein|nr:FtsX-like permease family protein [Acidobacteriaceae bacterium]